MSLIQYCVSLKRENLYTGRKKTVGNQSDMPPSDRLSRNLKKNILFWILESIAQLTNLDFHFRLPHLWGSMVLLFVSIHNVWGLLTAAWGTSIPAMHGISPMSYLQLQSSLTYPMYICIYQVCAYHCISDCSLNLSLNVQKALQDIKCSSHTITTLLVNCSQFIHFADDKNFGVILDFFPSSVTCPTITKESFVIFFSFKKDSGCVLPFP